MGMPVQAVQTHIRSSGTNTSCEVLPLPGVYGLSIEIESLTAHEAWFLVGVVGRGDIVEEVYPIEATRHRRVRRIHGCRGGERGRWRASRQAAVRSRPREAGPGG
jgi:hypothetical protein